MIVEPKVTLLAHTVIDDDVVAELMDIQPQSTDAETLIIFAGRSCYESWHRPRPETYYDKDCIDRTIFEQQHGSILEHATATLYFTGVSRAFLTELTRHRHLSFSVRSQRFVNEEDANIVIPPALRNLDSQIVYEIEDFYDDLEGPPSEALEWWFEDTLLNYESLMGALEDSGLKRKQAREAARAVLPSMTETKMVVTGNLRAWLQVIERRTAPDADAELQEVMGMARDVLKPLAPSIFGVVETEALNHVTPRPDLPRMQWPGNEPEDDVASATGGELTTQDVVDECRAVRKERSSSYAAAPRPEDGPVGEAWLLEVDGRVAIGFRNDPDDKIPWAVVYRDIERTGWLRDDEVTLVARLVPETTEQDDAPEAVSEVVRLHQALEERIRVWLIVADKLDNRGLAAEADVTRIHANELTRMLNGDANE